MLGASSRRLTSEAPPPVTGPGVMVAPSLTDNPYGTSAQVDRGESSPSLSISRSTCTDRSLPTPTTAGDGLPVASTARCFPDAGVIVFVQGVGPAATAADVMHLASTLDVER